MPAAGRHARRHLAARAARWRAARLAAVALVGAASARACWLCALALRELRGTPAFAANSSVVARGLVTRRATAASILQEHDRFFHSTGIKMTEGTAVAILTGHRSWRESFRVARRNAARFTHVAPAWFMISADGAAVHATESWAVRTLVAPLLRAPPARALTPVFSFRNLDFRRFLPADNRTHDALAERLAGLVARRCERSWGCDGALVDVHVALHERASSARHFANTLVRALAAHFHAAPPAHQRQLLVAVPAYSDSFRREDVAELHALVDSFVVQTFGFSSAKRPGPDAPLPWMMHALHGLVPAEDTASARKFVASIRLGGSDFREPKGMTRLCNRTRYLELLREHMPQLDWYAEASEHVFAYVDEKNATHSVYHPTLKSLHDRLGALRSWGVGVALDELHCGLDYWFDLF
ncbi:hypothetical protein KFE25_008887 [Diacronema lutheri]|uniref:GH18 domain-containing protein n=1 Tax=Diacronema lutheri TaxID=2081491 RepID=A0A8J6CGT8_DIALT|nr:hypothetical protein KFE25_008887 [Diacronema lutheri]